MNCDKGSVPERLASLPPGGPLKFRMRMASDPRLLSVVRSTVSELAAVWGFEDEQVRRITIAVDEALSNIIRHAYKNRCDQEIDLNFQAHADAWSSASSIVAKLQTPPGFALSPWMRSLWAGAGLTSSGRSWTRFATNDFPRGTCCASRSTSPAPRAKPDRHLHTCEEDLDENRNPRTDGIHHHRRDRRH